jgi:hypothetical protein
MMLPAPIQAIVADSVTQVFLLSLVVVAIAFVATMMVPELPMRDRKSPPPKDEIPADAHV